MFGWVSSQHISEGTIFMTKWNATKDNSTECIVITKCKTYLWLLKNNGTENVLQKFVDKICGIEGVSPMIECPLENQLITTQIQGNNISKGTSVNTFMQNKVKRCSGSLMILHFDHTNSRFQRSVLTHDVYPQLNELTDKFIIKLDVQGNCCWVIFDKTNLEGHKQNLGVGYNNPPNFHPNSAKKKICPF